MFVKLTPQSQAMISSQNPEIAAIRNNNWIPPIFGDLKPAEGKEYFLQDVRRGLELSGKSGFNHDDFNKATADEPNIPELLESQMNENFSGHATAFMETHNQRYITLFATSANRSFKKKLGEINIVDTNASWVAQISHNSQDETILTVEFNNIKLKTMYFPVFGMETHKLVNTNKDNTDRSLPGTVKKVYKWTPEGFQLQHICFSNTLLAKLFVRKQDMVITEENIENALAEEKSIEATASVENSGDEITVGADNNSQAQPITNNMNDTALASMLLGTEENSIEAAASVENSGDEITVGAANNSQAQPITNNMNDTALASMLLGTEENSIEAATSVESSGEKITANDYNQNRSADAPKTLSFYQRNEKKIWGIGLLLGAVGLGVTAGAAFVLGGAIFAVSTAVAIAIATPLLVMWTITKNKLHTRDLELAKKSAAEKRTSDALSTVGNLRHSAVNESNIEAAKQPDPVPEERRITQHSEPANNTKSMPNAKNLMYAAAVTSPMGFWYHTPEGIQRAARILLRVPRTSDNPQGCKAGG